MIVETFSSADAFLRVAEPSLQVHEDRCSLMYGIVLRLAAGHRFGEEAPILACVRDEDRVLALATQTPPHNLLVHVLEGVSDPLLSLVSALADRGVDLPGVHGQKRDALRFASAWHEITGHDHTISMEQRLYRLDTVEPVGVGVGKERAGRFRLAEPRDRDILVPWVEAFVEEAVGGRSHPDPGGLVERHTRAGTLGLWDCSGPVSMTASSRSTPGGAAISLVYTPPEARGRGHATACVAAMSQRLLDAGKAYCTLFTDLANPTSNALYQRIGYRTIGDFLEIRFLGD